MTDASVSQDRINEGVDVTLGRIEQLTELADDWDSYGGRRPSEIAIAGARAVLTRVASYAKSRPATVGIAMVTPWAVAPGSDGSVMIEWRFGNASLEVHCEPGGSLGYLFVQGEGAQRRYEEGEIYSPLTLIRRLRQVLRA